MLEHLCGYQEINHLSRDEQVRLIQKAKYEAHTTLGLSNMATFYLLLSMAIATLATQTVPSTLPSPALPLTAIISFTLCYHFLSKSLVAKGLRSILAKQRCSA